MTYRTDRTHYNTDHLTLDEIKAVSLAVFRDYMAVLTGKSDNSDPLYADFEEITEEHDFWQSALEARLAETSDAQ